MSQVQGYKINREKFLVDKTLFKIIRKLTLGKNYFGPKTNNLFQNVIKFFE